MKKVVVLGIDGGTFDLLGPWIKQGHLPALASLIKNGTSGVLASTYPPLTCPAWWSFSTGKNPGRFGAFHFWQLASRSYDISRAKSHGPRPGTELWDLINQAGGRCGIINNPIMFPPAKIRDYAVAGCFAGSRSNYTYPVEFKKKLDRISGKGGYELDVTSGQVRSDAKFYADCLRVLKKRRNVIRHLLSQPDRPDFFLAVFTESDRLCHRLLNRSCGGHPQAVDSRAMLLEFFKELDRALAEIAAMVSKDDYLFVLSDHGFGRRDQGFYINEWLRQEGYLSLHESGVFSAQAKSFFRRRLNDTINSLHLRDIVKAKVPRRLLVSLAPAGDREGEGQPVYDFIQSGLIDWPNTKAIALQDGLIYINTSDRPLGSIKPGKEYQQFREQLVDKLHKLHNPDTGGRLKTDVFRREEIFRGDFMAAAPDLYLTIENYSVAAFPNIRGDGKLTGPLALAGHRPQGMLIATGPGIKTGAIIESARIIDMAPTLLAVMGIGDPGGMDGHTLDDLFSHGQSPVGSRSLIAVPEIRGGQPSIVKTRTHEDDQVDQRLKELGYL